MIRAIRSTAPELALTIGWSTSEAALTLSQDLEIVTYHDYEGIALDHDEKERLVADLGEHNIMILRNHGTLTT